MNRLPQTITFAEIGEGQGRAQAAHRQSRSVARPEVQLERMPVYRPLVIATFLGAYLGGTGFGRLAAHPDRVWFWLVTLAAGALAMQVAGRHGYTQADFARGRWSLSAGPFAAQTRLVLVIAGYGLAAIALGAPRVLPLHALFFWALAAAHAIGWTEDGFAAIALSANLVVPGLVPGVLWPDVWFGAWSAPASLVLSGAGALAFLWFFEHRAPMGGVMVAGYAAIAAALVSPLATRGAGVDAVPRIAAAVLAWPLAAKAMERLLPLNYRPGPAGTALCVALVHLGPAAVVPGFAAGPGPAHAALALVEFALVVTLAALQLQARLRAEYGDGCYLDQRVPVPWLREGTDYPLESHVAD